MSRYHLKLHTNDLAMTIQSQRQVNQSSIVTGKLPSFNLNWTLSSYIMSTNVLSAKYQSAASSASTEKKLSRCATLWSTRVTLPSLSRLQNYHKFINAPISEARHPEPKAEKKWNRTHEIIGNRRILINSKPRSSP